MPTRRSSTILIIIGVLLIAAAAAIRFLFLPYATKLPDDLDNTAHYEGTADFLNPNALQSGDATKLLARDVPIALDRRVYVSDTNGDTATVHDDSTMNTPAGPVQSNLSYAMDRTSLEGTLLPADPATDGQSGLTVSLPLHPPKSSELKFLDATTRTSFPLTYVDSGSVSGRDVYNYQVSADGPVRDPAVASSLPPALPKSLVIDLLPSLPQPDRDEIAQALTTLEDAVPMTYTAETDIKFAADTVTGSPIDATTSQKVIANVTVSGRDVPVLTVSAVKASLTDKSIKSAADLSQTASRQLTLIGTVAPVVITVVGVALIGVGWLRRHPKIDA